MVLLLLKSLFIEPLTNYDCFLLLIIFFCKFYIFLYIYNVCYLLLLNIFAYKTFYSIKIH
jgi:hypothetical protein